MARSETWANAELAKGSVASSTALHRTWMEPSNCNRLRVVSAQPKSFLGKAISLFWGWL